MTPILAQPLDPGNDEARRWAEQELSDSDYQPPQPSWLDRFSERLWEWLADNIFGWFGGSDTIRVIVIVLAIALVLGLVVVVVRHLRRNPRVPEVASTPTSTTVMSGAARTAEEFRSEAENAYAAGQYDACVIASVRSMTRRGIERQLLADEPSLTAHDVAVDLGPRFPLHADALSRATDLFDAVAYGDRHASAESASRVLELDRAIASARPAQAEGNRPRRLAVPR